MERYWKIKNDFLPRGTVVFIYADDPRKIIKRVFGIEETVGEGYMGQMNAFDGSSGSRAYYVWVSSGLDDTSVIGAIAHEMSHVIDHIIQDHGFEAGMKGTELRAYLTSFYVERAIECVKRVKVKARKGAEKR